MGVRKRGVEISASACACSAKRNEGATEASRREIATKQNTRMRTRCGDECTIALSQRCRSSADLSSIPYLPLIGSRAMALRVLTNLGWDYCARLKRVPVAFSNELSENVTADADDR